MGQVSNKAYVKQIGPKSILGAKVLLFPALNSRTVCTLGYGQEVLLTGKVHRNGDTAFREVYVTIASLPAADQAPTAKYARDLLASMANKNPEMPGTIAKVSEIKFIIGWVVEPALSMSKPTPTELMQRDDGKPIDSQAFPSFGATKA